MILILAFMLLALQIFLIVEVSRNGGLHDTLKDADLQTLGTLFGPSVAIIYTLQKVVDEDEQ